LDVNDWLIAGLIDNQSRPCTIIGDDELFGRGGIGVNNGMFAIHRQVALDPRVPHDVKLLGWCGGTDPDIVGVRFHV
jgi:hypothetical protein